MLRCLERSYQLLKARNHPKGAHIAILRVLPLYFLVKVSSPEQPRQLPPLTAMSRPCLPRRLPAGRRQGKKLVPACSIFWCTGLAVISPKSSTEFWILNILEKNHNPFQKFYCIGDGTNQHVPLLWKQFVQRHLCKLYSAQHLHTNYLCNHVSLGVLHSRKCHSVSGKGGPSQDLSLHPVTLFRRAPTACKTFFFFFPLQTWPWTVLKTSSL